MKRAYDIMAAAPGQTLSLAGLTAALHGDPAGKSAVWVRAAQTNTSKLISRLRMELEAQTGMDGWLPWRRKGRERNETGGFNYSYRLR